MRLRPLSVLLVLAAFAGSAFAQAGAGPSQRAVQAKRGVKASAGGLSAPRHPKTLQRIEKKRSLRRALRLAARRAPSGAPAAAPAAPLGSVLLSESFTSGIPAGWTVLDNVGSGIEWSNLAGCGEQGNYTDGTGDAACVSSDLAGFGNYDTELRTPVLDFSNTVAPAGLSFTANYQYFNPQAAGHAPSGQPEAQAFEVDYSTNGAAGPWTNLLSWEESHGGFRVVGDGEAVNLDLSALAGQANVMLRFRYKHVFTKGFASDWYVQVDDVVVSGSPAGCALTCPTNISQSNDLGLCEAVVSFVTPTGEGQCGPIACAPASGDSFPVGTTQVTCSEQNLPLFGGLAFCSFNITVTDDEPPVIACPADQFAEIPEGSTDVVVNYPVLTASDNCTNPPDLSCAPPSGSSFPEGTSPVACDATDSANLTSSCGFDVIVTAGQGPPPSVLEIPTVSGKGLAGLALLLAAAGFVLLRRPH